MGKIDPDKYDIQTCSVRTGHVRTPENENSEPIFLNSSFVFKDAAEAAARFSGDEPGNIYSRFTNPTVRTFENRLAAMEGGERCIGTSSGMSAIMTTCMALLKSGDHIVSSKSIFGTTVGLFNNIFSKFGMETSFVDLTDYDAWAEAIRPETKILFLETPSNPLLGLTDLAAMADLAHSHNTKLVVDNTFASPYVQRPLEHGADLVIHSTTKYLNGHSDSIGGMVLTSNTEDETSLRFIQNTSGAIMGPFDAWLLLRGTKTLSLRMRTHSQNGLALAEFLSSHPKVHEVLYPGLPDHPQHALACRQMHGFSGMLSFDVGSLEAASTVCNRVRLLSLAVSLGGVESLISHPASMSHASVPRKERLERGIGDGLIRISTGIEDIQDLTEDMHQALDAI